MRRQIIFHTSAASSSGSNRGVSMSIWTLSIMALAILMSHTEQAFAQAWPNQPLGLNPVFDYAITTLPPCDNSASVQGFFLVDCNPNTTRVIQDNTAVLSPPNVAEFRRPVGQTGGGKLYFNTCPVEFGFD